MRYERKRVRTSRLLLFGKTASSSSTKIGKGHIIHSQAREILANVMQFMKEEATNNSCGIPLTNFKERFLAATKVSEKTYRRPTLKGILNKLKENDISFEGGLSTLSKVLKRMGFKWRRSIDKRQILVESYDIRAKRIKYLRQLQIYMREGRPIVFTDESYIHSSHTQTKEWADDSLLGLKKPISKGQRLIMVHAGGREGFIPNQVEEKVLYQTIINFSIR
ncbi:hypothetical protein QE152_g143 [Popillia japonica]|uniref:Transposase n=1 Tax=Popillia japonica TaxID=7064 RepID=A0AAW1NKH6_POPJA